MRIRPQVQIFFLLFFFASGSFDHTVMIWQVESGQKLMTLIGHRGEISSAQFNWDCSFIITGSMDKMVKVSYNRTKEMILSFSLRLLHNRQSVGHEVVG